MIKPKQYVPILKGKRGEFRGLQKLPSSVLDYIVPVIDIVPPPFNKTLSNHIETTINYIRKYWYKERLLYIDGYMIKDYELLENGLHPVKHIFNELLSEGYNILPVIGSSTGPEYNEIIKRIVIETGSGTGLRIFRVPGVEFNFEINKLLTHLQLSSHNIDLILDQRSLEGINVNQFVPWIENNINQISFLMQWRSFVIAGGIFPINLSEIEPDQIFPLSRSEWHIWNRILSNHNIERFPVYSDYAISHPLILEYDTDRINMSASIRYTGDDDFYIYRGRGIKQYGSDQFYELAEMLINRSEYCGKDHCFGDEHIHSCSERNSKGNAETWRMVGTSHHITKVTDQLRQFFLNFNA